MAYCYRIWGFTYFADNLKQKLRLVAAVANHLEIKDGKLTGKVKGTIVDAKYKAQVLARLAKDLGSQWSKPLPLVMAQTILKC